MTYLTNDNGIVFAYDEDNNLISLTTEGEEIWNQDLDSMVFVSFSRPWKTDFTLKVKGAMLSDSSITFVCSGGDFSAELKFHLDKYLKTELAVKHCGTQIHEYFTCGLIIRTSAPSVQKITIPHLIYNDNPSSDPSRIVAHIGNIDGLGTIVEEHRLPIPGINAEWTSDSGQRYISLISVPDVKTGNDHDYWALGALYGNSGRGHELVATSGPLMFNGLKDVVYCGQGMPLPYERGYRTFLPGQKLKKVFYIDSGISTEGRGFKKLIEFGYDVLSPESAQQHSFEEMIEYKKNVTDSRYKKTDNSTGYLCFGSANSFGDISGRPEYYLYAWTGQALKIAWCEIKLGLDSDKDLFRMERAVESVDFFVNGTEGETPGLLRCYYTPGSGTWSGSWDNPLSNLSSRMEGEALIDLIDIMLLLKRYERTVPASWEELVKRACSFLSSDDSLTMDGIYPLSWNSSGTPVEQFVNTAGVSCVEALAMAFQYFGDKNYLEKSVEIFKKYYDYHMRTFDIPFSRATFDAKCEDKEAGIYVFRAAARLYALTENIFYKEAADDAACWLLTFVYFWNTGFLPGSQCDEKGFNTTGWPGVSVQNHHLDVFFPSWEMYAYGKDTKNEILEHMGMTVAKALTYGVCSYPGEWGFSVIGEQGEQYYHTNYYQAWYPDLLSHLDYWRGKMRNWNPLWITAQVLQASIRFHDEENNI